MTRLAGGGATPVKAPPRVRASPKPRYVAPAPVPKPAPLPKPSYVPTKTTSGANPRGVSVPKHAPKPTKADKAANFIGTGANPRGVAIHTPKAGGLTVKQVKHQIAARAAASQSSGGGGILGAIEGAPIIGSIAGTVTHIPSDIVHGVEDVAKVPVIHNTLTDIRDLVPTTIEGINTIAQAGAHDLLGIATGATHVGPGAVTQPAAQHSELKALAENAWKTSITHDVLTGNFKGALHNLVTHPLYGALEFAGNVGIVGRVAGAAARTGALGAKAAEVAKLARDDRTLVPGTPGLKRHGSQNLIIRVGQHAKDKVELPGPIERRVVAHHVRKNVNDIYGIQGAIASKHADEIIAEQHAAAQGERGAVGKVAAHTPIVKNFIAHHIPADRRVANDVASAQVMGAVSRKSAITDLEKLHDSIQYHLDNTPMTKTARKAAEANRDYIATFLHDPNVKALNEINDSFLARAAQQTAEQRDLGLLSEAQAETAPLHGAVAMGHVPGDDIHIATASEKLPAPGAATYLHAVQDVKIEEARLSAGQAEAAKLPVEERPAYLAAAKENLKEAKSEKKALKGYKGKKVVGIVERTGERLPGRQPVFAYRRVPADEVRRRLISVGRNPDEMSYFNMTPPVGKEERAASQATRGLTRPDAAYHSRTAQGVPKGNFRPGGGGLLDTQLQTQRSIDRARGFDLLDKQQSIRDESGKLINSDKYGIQAAKEKFEAEHPDIPVTIVPRHSANAVNRVDDFVKSGGDMGIDGDTKGVKKSERFGLMPTVAADHYLKHLAADKVGNGAWGAMNRAFRNTVLPLSPKWIAGNDIEGLIRSGLVGAGPADAHIVTRVLKTLRATDRGQEADTIEAIMNGQHYSMANRRNHEALVQGSLEHPDKQMLIRNRPGIKQLADLYMHGIVEPVFNFNRKVESGFDRAVLGAHMHHQMIEFGANMYQAAKIEQKWIDKLADGYSDPALVMDAGRFIQKTLGQYSRFGPTAKKLINTIAPFAPWYANALRFVYMTMPLDHPLVSSILLAAGKTVQGEYAAQSKSQGTLNDSVFGHRFGALSSALPVQGGGLVDISRYLPYGAFSGGPVNAITSPAGPQVQGPLLAMFAGEDPFGSPLKDKNGAVTDKGQEALVGLNEFALSIAGPLDLAYRIVANHGDTPYSGTTILNPELKPNSHHGGPGILGGVERSMIPGYPTYLNPQTAGSAAPVATGVVGRSGTGVVGRSGTGVVGRSGTTVVGR